MRKFFREGNSGGKLNHSIKWNKLTKAQTDGGLGLSNMKIRKLALLSKWAWRFMSEQNAQWRKVAKSIHGSHPFHWYKSGKEYLSLRSLWISIYRQWRKVEALAAFRVGYGSRVFFWTDPWLDVIPLSSKFPRLFHIALVPKGSVAEHWDSQTSSWSVYFRRLLKEEEVPKFQALLITLNGKVVNFSTNKRVWSLEPEGSFTVKSLVNHLTTASPIDATLHRSQFSQSSILQKKVPSHCLSPHMCHLCCNNQEDLQHIFFNFPHAVNCWYRLLQIFNFSRAFDGNLRDNMLQTVWPSLEENFFTIMVQSSQGPTCRIMV